jgi:hypothetical protein
LAPGIKNDLKGKIIGSLLVTGDSGERHRNGEILWNTECVCGTKNHLVRSSKLADKITLSCGCRTKIKKKLPGTRELRKKLKNNLKSLSNAEFTEEVRREIFFEFVQGATFKDLAKKYKITVTGMKSFIRKLRDSINTSWELNILMQVEQNQLTEPQLDNALATKYVSDSLKELLSTPDSPTLTEAEIVYSWIYVNSGSNGIALKESGLREVLKKTQQTEVYLNLIGIYLREKQNIAQYICELQKEFVKTTDVSKKYVQSELIRQVEQLKEICASDSAQRNRSNMLKAIELLGRSVGSFTDKVQVEQVDHKGALDILVEKAQEEVRAGSYTVEDSD